MTSNLVITFYNIDSYFNRMEYDKYNDQKANKSSPWVDFS